MSTCVKLQKGKKLFFVEVSVKKMFLEEERTEESFNNLLEKQIDILGDVTFPNPQGPLCFHFIYFFPAAIFTEHFVSDLQKGINLFGESWLMSSIYSGRNCAKPSVKHNKCCHNSLVHLIFPQHKSFWNSN